ncbi:hypothetical protein CEE69_17325 [Rhodopirellula bahusiensis]|uniref:Uncharacterized protein n=1 Tax=Rhodopirellula bahusiensis TaxID=2014065 RepID=A0A2G1W4V3_9BACT|nr:hypothetical protein CEE69_17325 [Rhodopirellula bahusiensis]
MPIPFNSSKAISVCYWGLDGAKTLVLTRFPQRYRLTIGRLPCQRNPKARSEQHGDPPESTSFSRRLVDVYRDAKNLQRQKSSSSKADYANTGVMPPLPQLAESLLRQSPSK